MIGWIFPLLLVAWFATVIAGKRVQRRVSALDPASQNQFVGSATNAAPASLMRAVLRGPLPDVSDAALVRACNIYRASLYLYFATMATVIVVLAIVAFSRII